MEQSREKSSAFPYTSGHPRLWLPNLIYYKCYDNSESCLFVMWPTILKVSMELFSNWISFYVNVNHYAHKTMDLHSCHRTGKYCKEDVQLHMLQVSLPHNIQRSEHLVLGVNRTYLKTTLDRPSGSKDWFGVQSFSFLTAQPIFFLVRREGGRKRIMLSARNFCNSHIQNLNLEHRIYFLQW